jgi:hypothetical protein
MCVGAGARAEMKHEVGVRSGCEKKIGIHNTLWLSSSLRLVQADMTRLTCLADLSTLNCPGCPVLAVMPRLSFHGCPVSIVLSQLSSLVMFWLFVIFFL